MAAASPMAKVLNLCAKFVTDQDGKWNHEDWERLSAQVQKLGYPCDQDECKRNLGNILESCRYFYRHVPQGAAGAAPAKKRAPAKKKTA
jgi:hypothetical protein